MEQKSNTEPTLCDSCGKAHVEFPTIGFSTPHYYDILNIKDKNEIAEISNDFCVITHEDQTDRFIRANISIPILNQCSSLDYGIWVSVSKKSFDEYVNEYNDNMENKVYFGMISNEIADYNESTLALHTDVITQANGLRPEISPHENTHELF